MSSVDFYYASGVEAKDFKQVAKLSDLQTVDKELDRVSDSLREIKHEMQEMRERESQMRDLNELLNSRVVWSSILSIIVLIIVGIFQLCYLRDYFLEKKVI